MMMMKRLTRHETPSHLKRRKPDTGTYASENELGRDEKQSISNAEKGIKVIELITLEVELNSQLFLHSFCLN